MADTKISALTAVGTAASTDEFGVNQGSVSKRMTLAQIQAYISGLSFVRINGNSGAAGDVKTLQKLSANATANTTTTLATVMTTTGLATGTYTFVYQIIYQSATLTVGVDFAIGFSGTNGSIVMTSRFASTGGAAATGGADQTSTATANMLEGKGQRAKATKLGNTVSVGAINADMHYVIEGIIVVTASGDLTLQHNSETATSTQVMANTCLELTKVG